MKKPIAVCFSLKKPDGQKHHSKDALISLKTVPSNNSNFCNFDTRFFSPRQEKQSKVKMDSTAATLTRVCCLLCESVKKERVDVSKELRSFVVQNKHVMMWVNQLFQEHYF